MVSVPAASTSREQLTTLISITMPKAKGMSNHVMSISEMLESVNPQQVSSVAIYHRKKRAFYKPQPHLILGTALVHYTHNSCSSFLQPISMPSLTP